MGGGLVFPFFGKRSKDTSIKKLGQPSPTQIVGLLRFFSEVLLSGGWNALKAWSPAQSVFPKIFYCPDVGF